MKKLLTFFFMLALWAGVGFYSPECRGQQPPQSCIPWFNVCLPECGNDCVNLVNEHVGGLRCTDEYTCEECFQLYYQYQGTGCYFSCAAGSSPYYKWVISAFDLNGILVSTQEICTPFMESFCLPASQFMDPLVDHYGVEMFLMCGDYQTCSGNVYAGSANNFTFPRLTSVTFPGFTWSPQPACVGSTVTFIDQSIDALDVVWIVDGGPDVPGNPNYSYTFTTPGPHTVSQIVVGTGGCLDTLTQIVNVMAPAAEFTFVNACAGQAVQFTDASVCATSWSWNFGDGSPVSTQQNPSHVYSVPGTYTVTLSINGGGAVISHIVVVNPVPAVPVIVGALTTCGGNTQGYQVSLNFGSTYAWTATGGTPATGTGQAINVTWGANGGTISVTETNGFGCKATATASVAPCCNAPAVWQLGNAGAAGAYPDAVSLIAANGGSNTFSNTTMVVNGTFTVNANLNWITCDVKFGGNARMNVNAGRILDIVADSWLHACGNQMWDGIYIQGVTATLKMRNIRVQDALHAVVSQSGGYYQIGGTNFDLNWVAVEVQPYNTLSSSSVTGNTFQCSNTALMLPPHAGQRSLFGVYADQVNGLVVGLPSMGGNHPPNTFRNLQVGVRSVKSIVAVRHNRFEWTAGGGNGNLSAGIGVHATGQSGFLFPPFTLYTLSVGGMGMLESNEFSGLRFGVLAQDNLHVSVVGNSFSNGQLEAVRVQTCRFATVKVLNNAITNTRIGIHSLMNTSAVVSILNNTINYSGASLGKGVWIEDINYKFKINPSLVKVEDNVLNIKGNGVQVGATHRVEIRRNKIEITPGLITQQVYGVLAQGSPKVVVENHSAPAFISSSAAGNLNVRGVWIENSPEAFVSCNSIDAFGQHLTFSGSCPNSEMWRNTMQFGVRGVVLTNNGVIGTQGGPGMPVDNRWIGSFGFEAFRDQFLGANPWYVRTGGVFNPIPNLAISGGPGFPIQFTNGAVQLCTSGPLQINSPQLRQRIAQDQLTFPFLEQENKKLAREYLFHALDADPSLLSNDAMLQGWYAGNSNAVLGAEESVTEYSEAGNFSMALSTNGGISPTLVMESNAKEVNGIYNTWATSGAGDLSAQQVSCLEAIAVQCPSEGGYAVYQARTMLCLAGNCGDYATDCGSPVSKMDGEPEGVDVVEVAVQMYPNPANEVVTLTGEMPEGATISMVNLMGAVVIEMPFVDDMEVNTLDLTTGLYFMRISLNGRVLAVEKLMIQR